MKNYEFFYHLTTTNEVNCNRWEDRKEFIDETRSGEKLIKPSIKSVILIKKQCQFVTNRLSNNEDKEYFLENDEKRLKKQSRCH